MSDKGFWELRNQETEDCLKHLKPIARACASCDKLYECDTGGKIVFGDISITEKVVDYNYIASIPALKKMSYEELVEYNKATRDRDAILRSREQNKLTAGAYVDGKWVTDPLTNKDRFETAKDETLSKRLTAGYWDSKKKRWVGEK